MLATAPPGPAFVADARRVGTTLYTAPHEAFDPRFGLGSRGRTSAAGAVELSGAGAALRHDVDDLAISDTSLVLGVGDRTPPG